MFYFVTPSFLALIEIDPFDTRLVILVSFSIHHVLLMGTYAKIFFAIIQGVAVTVINLAVVVNI